MAIAAKIKYFIKYFALGLLFMILLTYVLGWYDLVNNNWLTGNWLKDLYRMGIYLLVGIYFSRWFIDWPPYNRSTRIGQNLKKKLDPLTSLHAHYCINLAMDNNAKRLPT